MTASGLSSLKKDQIAERGARPARRDDQAYRESFFSEDRPLDTRSRAAACVALLLLAVGAGSGVSAIAFTTPHQKGSTMAKHASGTFDVKVVPQKDEGVGDTTIGRMSIDKQYHGDLEGTGLGQMLAGMAADVKDSGAYVAIERVRGTLQGRKGSFAVHHRGVITRGAQDLVITVIPDSGTEELTGIAGTMTIDIRDGKHFYGFDYTLP